MDHIKAALYRLVVYLLVSCLLFALGHQMAYGVSESTIPQGWIV